MSLREGAGAWDVLVVGGGPAGVTAALRARECGAERVALVERDPRLGGTCTNDGCVPTRVWAKAARFLRDAADAANYGVATAGGPPTLDFAGLQRRTRETVHALHDRKRLAERLSEAGVDVLTGRGSARFADPNTVVLGGGEDGGANARLRAERFVLCAGGSARRPPFPGAELTLGPTDLWSLASLPRRVVVVGAAATGCQIASVLNAFGSEVTLLEVAPRVLPQEDAAVSEAMADALARHGVRVEVGVEGGVSSVTRAAPGEPLVVRWGEAASESEAEADVVVCATGWPGNVAALGLEEAGVSATENGEYVAVDDTLRSVSAAHVWAAGDLTGRMMLVQCAYDDARIAGENAARGGRCLADDPASRLVPHGGFTDPEYG
ncbi:MAG TPA: NAD(P)/FAD-dependent oxidoreductase, partial [Armatimonadaceae bacterium]|nr:NAD(P)/FAD-dependent oxidoreductase [Armatimonadaceae bacterium]